MNPELAVLCVDLLSIWERWTDGDPSLGWFKEGVGRTSIGEENTRLFQVGVRVTLRPAVLDTQGQAILHGLHALGFAAIEDLHAGKCFRLAVRATDQQHAEATVRGAPGTLVVLFGAATGRDGIHGASFASVELDERSEERRPAVQVGDPLTEKLLLEACLELRDRGLLVGLQDLGAAGLTNSTVEMADKTGSGIEIDLDQVPRRAPAMTPYELLLSESQERMLAAVEPSRLSEVEAVLDRWELPHAVIGRITDDRVVRMRAKGQVVVEVPVRTFTDDCPNYVLTGSEDQEIRQARMTEPTLPIETDYGRALLDLLNHPNLASKRAIWRCYDHITNTILGPGADAAVPMAVGYAQQSGIPYCEGLVKNRYVGRTFISPTQPEPAR